MELAPTSGLEVLGANDAQRNATLRALDAADGMASEKGAGSDELSTLKGDLQSSIQDLDAVTSSAVQACVKLTMVAVSGGYESQGAAGLSDILRAMSDIPKKNNIPSDWAVTRQADHQDSCSQTSCPSRS